MAEAIADKSLLLAGSGEAAIIAGNGRVLAFNSAGFALDVNA
jgi:hypothetical protein